LDQLSYTPGAQEVEVLRKPTFLKILCILSFVMCALMIVCCAISYVVVSNLDAASSEELWGKLSKIPMGLEAVDPSVFFSEVGKLCLFTLSGNVISLIGVFMMWRLSRIGFFVYVVAEIITNFVGFLTDVPNDSNSLGSLIMYLLIDIGFIVMYAFNLKHMQKKAPIF